MELEVGTPCKVKSIIGGSLGFNQIAQNGNFATKDNWTNTAGSTFWSVSNNKATVTWTPEYSNNGLQQAVPFVKDHKYFVTATAKNLGDSSKSFQVGQPYGVKTGSVSIGAGETKTIVGVLSMGATVSGQGYALSFFAYSTSSSACTVELSNFMCIDLTAMFGSTIADYIYSLDARVAWVKRYLPKSYYPYCAIGSFVHVQTKGKKTVKFNQFDITTLLEDNRWTKSGDYYQATANSQKIFDNRELKYQGRIEISIEGHAASGVNYRPEFHYTDGTTSSSAPYINDTEASKTWISTSGKVVEYVLMTYSTSGTVYIKKICVSLYYDGERTGEYEDFTTNTVAVDPVELIGVPKLDSNGNLYFDGNRYNANGTVEKEWGIVNLGSYNYSYNGYTFSAGLSPACKAPADLDAATVAFCTKYKSVSFNAITNAEGQLAVYSNGVIYIRDSTYTSAESFKAAMNGVYLIYPLATPTTDSATPFTETQPVDNWGTEEWLAPDDDTRAVVVPVGHDTDYLPDYKAKVEVAADMPGEDGVYVLTQEDGENVFTPLATYLGDNGYYKMQDLSSEITDNRSLSWDIKKAYKCNNLVTLTVRASAPSSITTGNHIIQLGSSLRPSAVIYAYARANGQTSQIYINADGQIFCSDDIDASGYIIFTITYAVA